MNTVFFFFHFSLQITIGFLSMIFFFLVAFRFLWNVYCNDSGTYIIKQEFLKALQIEETYQPATSQPLNNKTIESQTHLHSILTSLFSHSDRVGFDQFRAWITRHERATVLSRWLMLDSGVNLTTELETPTFYQSLAGVTHLEEQVNPKILNP